MKHSDLFMLITYAIGTTTVLIYSIIQIIKLKDKELIEEHIWMLLAGFTPFSMIIPFIGLLFILYIIFIRLPFKLILKLKNLED